MLRRASSDRTIFDILVKRLYYWRCCVRTPRSGGRIMHQRTLNKGRWYGFVTGLGASLSDIAYALLWLRDELCVRLY